jgi:hypothetical protein
MHFMHGSTRTVTASVASVKDINFKGKRAKCVLKVLDILSK